MTKPEQRNIWWRAGGFSIDGTRGDGIVTLAEPRYRRGNTRKYPNRSERRWWERQANDPESGAKI